MIRFGSIVTAAVAAAALTLTVACGGSEQAAAPPPPPPAKVKSKKADMVPWRDALGQRKLRKYGKQIFMTQGSNTCNDCHGADGMTGRLAAESANLTEPDTWRSTRALGGNTKKVTKALRYLIRNGATQFNESFVKENPDLGWDWEKADATAYNIQMFGVTQSAIASELKKIRKALKKDGIDVPKDELPDFGARAALAYVRSLSDDAVAGKGKGKGKGGKGKGKGKGGKGKAGKGGKGKGKGKR